MKTTATLSLIATLSLVGCSKPADPAGSTSTSPPQVVMDGPPPTLDEHAHGEHGPHGGDLIELGKEAFHAELVHGADGVSIHVLDSSASKPVAIASAKLTVSMKHEGEVRSFDLAANPDSGDASGMASRFTSTDPELDQWIDAGAEGAVVIAIEGKSFTGKIVHDHDHHDHAH